MTVALGPATTNGSTLFGLTRHEILGGSGALVFKPNQPHAPDETVPLQYLQLPQVQQTFAVVGYQPQDRWGLWHGVNEHQVAVGYSNWQSLVRCTQPGLTGADLVRLVLERTAHARQAVDVLTDLLALHNQGRFSTSLESHDEDAIFLIADPQEAFVVETAGRYWALHEISQVRAISDVGLIRQDWNRLSPGLADYAVECGLWECDGSKLDFAGTIAAQPQGNASALRRWGRSTSMLEGQNGHIDLLFLRRLFSDHYEGTSFEVEPAAISAGDPSTLCQHASATNACQSQVSCLLELTRQLETPKVMWFAFGPPCISVYCPTFLMPDASPLDDYSEWLQDYSRQLQAAAQQMSEVLALGEEHWTGSREKLSWLQARIDDEVAEFLSEAAQLRVSQEFEAILRLGQRLMEHHAEAVEELVQEIAQQAAEAAPSSLALS